MSIDNWIIAITSIIAIISISSELISDKKDSLKKIKKVFKTIALIFTIALLPILFYKSRLDNEEKEKNNNNQSAILYKSQRVLTSLDSVRENIDSLSSGMSQSVMKQNELLFQAQRSMTPIKDILISFQLVYDDTSAISSFVNFLKKRVESSVGFKDKINQYLKDPIYYGHQKAIQVPLTPPVIINPDQFPYDSPETYLKKFSYGYFEYYVSNDGSLSLNNIGFDKIADLEKYLPNGKERDELELRIDSDTLKLMNALETPPILNLDIDNKLELYSQQSYHFRIDIDVKSKKLTISYFRLRLKRGKDANEIYSSIDMRKKNFKIEGFSLCNSREIYPTHIQNVILGFGNEYSNLISFPNNAFRNIGDPCYWGFSTKIP